MKKNPWCDATHIHIMTATKCTTHAYGVVAGVVVGLVAVSSSGGWGGRERERESGVVVGG